MQLMQMVIQGRWFTDSTLLTLPFLTDRLVRDLHQNVSLNFKIPILLQNIAQTFKEFLVKTSLFYDE